MKVAAVDPAQLNFAYTIERSRTCRGSRLRAFDDGSHVYIQMPAGNEVERGSRAADQCAAAEPRW